MTAFVKTYSDVINRMESFFKSRATAPSIDTDTMRSCIETGLREIATTRDWNSMKQIHRINLSASYSTGTVAYDATTRQVTLSGGTWPDWALVGELRIGTDAVNCQIEKVDSPTVLTLASSTLPAATIAAGATYTLARTWYELPAEFMASWSPAEKNAWFIGEYIPFEEWFLFDKYRNMTGIVKRWSIGPMPGKYNLLAIYVYPIPQTAEGYDLLLKMRPRTMLITGKDAWNYAGKVSIAAGSYTVQGSSTLVGTTTTYQTAFRDLMIGSIVRFSLDTTNLPTDTNGTNPYGFQARIVDVDTDLQTLTLDTPAPAAYTAVRYVVSDPLVLSEGLYDAFLRCCEHQLAQATGMKDAAAVERRYLVALQNAKMSDSVVNQPRFVGGVSRKITRLRDFKTRPWVS